MKAYKFKFQSLKKIGSFVFRVCGTKLSVSKFFVMSFQDYFTFQTYLANQILKAVTFFVKATFNDLFRYIIAAATYGPFADDPAYSVSAFTASTNGDIHGEVRLTKLIEKSLLELQFGDQVEYCPTEQLYYAAHIRNNDSHRTKISHIIFQAFEQNENRANWTTLISCVKANANFYDIKEVVIGFGESRETPNTAALATKLILVRLMALECVYEDVNELALYEINFE